MHDLFNVIGGKKFDSDFLYNIEGIVYNYEGLVLCPTSIEIIVSEDITTENSENDNFSRVRYDLSGKEIAVGNNGVVSSVASSLHLPHRLFFAHARRNVTFIGRSTIAVLMFISSATAIAAFISSPGFTPALTPMRR